MQPTFEGVYRNGAVELAGVVPFFEGQKVLVVSSEGQSAVPLGESDRPLEERVAELDKYFSCVRVKTRGWKFDREEANER